MSRAAPNSGQQLQARPPRRRHWWRWVLSGVLGLAVLLVAGSVAAFKLQPSQPPLALPAGAAVAPAGPLGGTWRVAAGSVAGFRIRESFFGMGNEITGRTGDVTGSAVLTTGRMESATFQVSLQAITVNGKGGQSQLIQSLGAGAHPFATVTLARDVRLPGAFAVGAVITTSATASLTLNGTTRPVTVTLSARRDGPVIQAAGSLPVTFADFGIKGPSGYGVFGSLAGNGTAEFLLILAPAEAR